MVRGSSDKGEVLVQFGPLTRGDCEWRLGSSFTTVPDGAQVSLLAGSLQWGWA